MILYFYNENYPNPNLKVKMKSNATPKSNYKIWDPNRKRYISINRKSSWVSPIWVCRAAENYMHKIKGLEIHIFPIETAIVHKAIDYVALVKTDWKNEAAKKEAAKKAKLEKGKANREINDSLELYKKSLENIRMAKDTLAKHGIHGIVKTENV